VDERSEIHHQQISRKVDCASLIHPTLKQSLPVNMPVKILVEDQFEKNEEVPVLGEDYSFLKVAMQAKLRGPKDFSENINDYLKMEKLDWHDE
jgi:cytochrome c oxidase assembly protein Cox11